MGAILSLRNKTAEAPRLLVVIVAALAALVASMMMALPAAHADGEDSAAMQTLSQEVAVAVSNNTYEVDGGGSIKGSQLFSKDAGGVYVINQSEYKLLSADGRTSFADDVVIASEKSVSNGSKTGVTKQTQTNWFRNLQNTPGFGSKLLTEALKETGPDMVGGQQLYAPFAPIVSQILGLLVIVIFSFFALTVALDVCYITIPAVRLFTGGGDGGEAKGVQKVASKLVSSAAVRGVQDEEGGDGTKNALVYYFKNSIVKMFLLALILVFLVNGQLWAIIGTMMDLLLGFIYG